MTFVTQGICLPNIFKKTACRYSGQAAYALFVFFFRKAIKQFPPIFSYWLLFHGLEVRTQLRPPPIKWKRERIHPPGQRPGLLVPAGCPTFGGGSQHCLIGPSANATVEVVHLGKAFICHIIARLATSGSAAAVDEVGFIFI